MPPGSDWPPEAFLNKLIIKKRSARKDIGEKYKYKEDKESCCKTFATDMAYCDFCNPLLYGGKRYG